LRMFERIGGVHSMTDDVSKAVQQAELLLCERWPATTQNAYFYISSRYTDY